LLPDDLLPLRIIEGQAIVGYVGEGDQTWLRALIDEFERHVGRPERELRQRLNEPLPLPSPFLQRRVATTVLSRLWRSTIRAPLAPREARRAVFDDMAAGGGSRSDVLTRVGLRLGIAPAALAAALFADLPGERIVVSPQAIPNPADAIRRINLTLAQAMLFRATSVRVRAEGGVRPLVRLAKLRGLISAVSTPPGHSAPLLEISGPYSLFRRTLLYGRALAAIVPPLVASGRFSLKATCVVRGQALDFALATGDPVSAQEQGRHFDSQLEERFVRDFRKAAPDWDVIREPEAVRAGAGLIFPDFLLRHRRDPARNFLVEIVGFWTRGYLEKKFAALRKAKLENLIICVDAERGCSEGDLPLGARVVRFKRKIDAATVLALMTTAGDTSERRP
jgi:predicted nuclease of restriction endonuclease-like RecB superfamily